MSPFKLISRIIQLKKHNFRLWVKIRPKSNFSKEQFEILCLVKLRGPWGHIVKLFLPLQLSFLFFDLPTCNLHAVNLNVKPRASAKKPSHPCKKLHFAHFLTLTEGRGKKETKDKPWVTLATGHNLIYFHIYNCTTRGINISCCLHSSLNWALEFKKDVFAVVLCMDKKWIWDCAIC